MKEIIYIVGLVSFICNAFNHLGVWDIIARRSITIKSKFFRKLFNCEFCMMFHVTWISSLFISVFLPMTYSELTLNILVSSGVFTILNRIR